MRTPTTPTRAAVVPLAATLAALAGLLALAPQAAPAQVMQFPPPLELRVPKAPSVLSGDGGRTLVYELHVTNFSPATFALRRLEILSDADGRVLFALQDTALGRTLNRPGLALPRSARPARRSAAGCAPSHSSGFRSPGRCPRDCGTA